MQSRQRATVIQSQHGCVRTRYSDRSDTWRSAARQQRRLPGWATTLTYQKRVLCSRHTPSLCLSRPDESDAGHCIRVTRGVSHRPESRRCVKRKNLQHLFSSTSLHGPCPVVRLRQLRDHILKFQCFLGRVFAQMTSCARVHRCNCQEEVSFHSVRHLRYRISPPPDLRSHFMSGNDCCIRAFTAQSHSGQKPKETRLQHCLRVKVWMAPAVHMSSVHTPSK